MKRFLKKRWHSIPVALVSAVLVLALTAGGAFAAVYITTDQTINQVVTLDYEYGTITAQTIALPRVKVGETSTTTCEQCVIVDLKTDGVGKALRMVCDADPLYDSFDVTITLISKPDGSGVGLYGYGITAGGEVAIDLDVEGRYTFDQTILVTTGSSAGTATSTVTFTLEDSTTPPR